MSLGDGVMGWFHGGNVDGLGSSMGSVGEAKASYVSKFVEFYKSVSI